MLPMDTLDCTSFHNACADQRLLWFNMDFGDWQFTLGSDPLEGPMVMYSDFGQVGARFWFCV